MIPYLPWIIAAVMTAAAALLAVLYFNQRKKSNRAVRNTPSSAPEQENSENRENSTISDEIVNLSHDLRTPITAIYGYLDLLQNEEKSENAERYISQIENRVGVLNHLTEELFGCAVVESLATEKGSTVDLKAELEESLAAFYGLFVQNNITPELDLPEGKVLCVLDRVSVSRVFGNIITNALKYSLGDFRVSMTSGGEICFSNRASLPEQVTGEMLLARYYTVDSAARSTGLGLSIAKTLVEKMGGRINALFRDGTLFIKLEFDTAEEQKDNR